MSDVFALTVVVPCFNEEDNVPAAYAEIIADLGVHDLEVIFVDDGSTDATLPLIKQLAATDQRVHYISFARNFGFEAAFSAGYTYARKPWILHLDADLQFPPGEAHHLIQQAGSDCDVVFGIRGHRHDPWYRTWGAIAYHALSRRVFGIRIPPGATTFRLVRTQIARRIVELRLGTPYFLATLPQLTDRFRTVTVAHRDRTRGQSKFGLSRLLAHAIELYVAFSRRALHGVALLSLLGAALSALTAVLGPWRPVSAGTVLLGAAAVILVGLAVLARYIGLIADAQRRPDLFYIRESSLPIDPAHHLYGSPAMEAV